MELPTGLRIRDARPDDAAQVARVYIESWNAGFGHLMGMREQDDARVERWRADLSAPPPMHWWVAEREARIVAIAGVGPSRDPVDPKLGELDTLHVDPSHFRSGIGRALFDLALSQLRRDGYEELVLWTVAGYPRARHFYEAMGLELAGATRDDGRQVMYRRAL